MLYKNDVFQTTYPKRWKAQGYYAPNSSLENSFELRDGKLS